MAKQGNQPFTERAPDLPTSPGMAVYYAPRGTMRTSGREFQILAFDIRKSHAPPLRFHMPEITKVVKNIVEGFATQQDIRRAFGSYPARNVPVGGVDPGEVVPAAGCGINIDLTRMVSTLKIKCAAIYAPIFRERFVMNQLKEEPPPIPNPTHSWGCCYTEAKRVCQRRPEWD
ncbi:hypothetical protein BGZ68_002684, partial [Mortierella alpina]